jgi:hypothetical protein
MREATASASDTRATLERAVQTSGQSVALYDLERLKILAVSPPAREQLGLDGVDLGTFDLVESSSNPDATRQLLALIRDGQLKEWKVRSRLRDASGQPFVGYATGRLLDFDKSRRLALTVYPYRSPSGEEETRSGGTATALTIGSVDEHGRIDRVTGDVESMLGFAPRDLIGELFLSLLHPGDAPKSAMRSTDERVGTRLPRYRYGSGQTEPPGATCASASTDQGRRPTRSRLPSPSVPPSSV